MRIQPRTQRDRKYRIDFALTVLTGNLTRYKNLRPVVETDDSVMARWYPIRTWVVNDPLRFLPGMIRIRARHLLDTWQLFVRRPADAVVLHAFETDTLFCFLKWLLRRETIVKKNPDWAVPPAAEGIRGSLRRLSVRMTDLIVTFSQAAADLTQERYPDFPADRIVVLHPGMDLGLWPLRRPRTPSERFELLFVGGDLKRKGIATLLDAFDELPADRYTLHIVTQLLQPANDFEVWSQRIASSPNAAQIHLHLDLQPNSGELMELYRTCDAFVLPTNGDASSWVALEAMATGLPIVSTGVGGIPDIVIHEQTGLLVPPRDAATLAQTIERLRIDESLRTRLIARGRRHVEEHFEVTRNTKQLLTMIKAVVENRQVPASDSVPAPVGVVERAHAETVAQTRI